MNPTVQLVDEYEAVARAGGRRGYGQGGWVYRPLSSDAIGLSSDGGRGVVCDLSEQWGSRDRASISTMVAPSAGRCAAGVGAALGFVVLANGEARLKESRQTTRPPTHAIGW